MSDGRIADDEVLYRRIPPGLSWFEPPDRISSGNFKLQDNELGVSVYRAAIVDAAHVLSDPQAKPGSRVVEATASQIRAARDGNDNPLCLDIVAVNDENDPGHAEIRGPIPGKISNGAARALKALFRFRGVSPWQAEDAADMQR